MLKRKNKEKLKANYTNANNKMETERKQIHEIKVINSDLNFYFNTEFRFKN